jgi:hypothetical protein
LRIRDVYPGSGGLIPNPGSGFFHHGSIQGLNKPPDPGSGSATLLICPKIKAKKTNNILQKRNNPDPSEAQIEIKGTVA